jgi:hypothetical protein
MRTRLLQLIAGVVLTMVWPFHSIGAPIMHDVVEFSATTGESITCAWDASESPGVEFYEFLVRSDERLTDVVYVLGNVLQFSFKLPRTGHYTVGVRACNMDRTVNPPKANCSEWAMSTDPKSNPQIKMPDGTFVTRPWRLYGGPAAPGPIVIK